MCVCVRRRQSRVAEQHSTVQTAPKLQQRAAARIKLEQSTKIMTFLHFFGDRAASLYLLVDRSTLTQHNPSRVRSFVVSSVVVALDYHHHVMRSQFARFSEILTMWSRTFRDWVHSLTYLLCWAAVYIVVVYLVHIMTSPISMAISQEGAPEDRFFVGSRR